MHRARFLKVGLSYTGACELADALDSLPARQGEAMGLLLAGIVDWGRRLSYVEIARAMGIGVEGVRKHIYRARKRLKVYSAM